MDKEKTPLIVFYRKGEDGSIGAEFSNDLNMRFQLEQQLLGAMECFLKDMKEDLINRFYYSDDEKERRFS